MTVLRLKEIEKTYDSEFTLAPLELAIEEGEFFTLIGPSGCGKTTLLKVIAGLVTPDKGTIHHKGQDITEVVAERRHFAMMFQQPHLFPHMTVEQNVSFGLRMNKVPKTERTRRAKEALRQVGLESFAARYPSELSGGQQQRVSLARALVVEPELLLLDEPFSALDPQLKDEMQQLVKQLQKQLGITTVCVTHDQQEAFLLADRMAVMKEGKILQVGAPHTLYSHPDTRDVASFLGHTNVLAAQDAAALIPLTSLVRDNQLVIIPSEAIRLEETGTLGVIKHIQLQKDTALVTVALSKFEVVAKVWASRASNYKLGDQVFLNVEPNAIHLIPN